MCVSLQRRAIQNVKMYVSLQRRARKCMKWAHSVGSRPRHAKIIVSPQFRTSDQHEVTKGFPVPAGGWRERHINLQSKSRQHEAHAQFIRYTQRFRRGWRGWHINLQSKWSQHEAHAQFIRYTQRFRRGRRGWHINLQSKWSPRAIYTVYTTISAGSVADWGGGVY